MIIHITRNLLTAAVLLTTIFCKAQDVPARLDSLFTALADQNQFSGSVLIAEKGKIVYKGGKGFSNELTRERNNSRTIFELASCSKQFIGVGIVLLHRRNKISYTDDITKYLPELKSFEGVKISDLLRHTSGIPEFLGGDFSRDWNKEHIAANDDLLNYYAQRQFATEFVPGSKHRYCNTNYALLATVIERISGQTTGDYLSENIFRPLGMKRTFVYNRRLNPRKLKNYAYGYVWLPGSFEKATEDDPRVGWMNVYSMDGIVGNAKVSSTVEDLYKWVDAIAGNKLLTPAEFNEVMEITRTSAGETVNYGFGFEVRRSGDTISFGHTGSWDGYITLIHYSSANDRTIVVLNNFRNGVYPFETIAEIMDHKAPSNEFVKKIPLTEEQVRRFTGEYADPENPEEKHLVSYLDGHLVYNTNSANWDMRFFPSSENTFQAIRQGGVNGVMQFTEQPDGSMVLEMSQYGQQIGQGVRSKD